MAKTPAIYDFDAIGKTLAPDDRPDLPALFEELKVIVREFDAADEANDKAHWEALSNRLGEKRKLMEGAIAPDLAALRAQLEWLVLNEHPILREKEIFDNILASVRTMAASAEPQPAVTGDTAILAKFREWIAACDAADAFTSECFELARAAGDAHAADSYPAWRAKFDDADELAAEVAEMPANGVAGLAIKVFLASWARNHASRRTVGIGCVSDNCDGDLIKACLRDAIRFAPVLELLCVDCLEEADEAEDEQAAEVRS
jgi:hypothetical protein